jgi:hypothetical protein
VPATKVPALPPGVLERAPCLLMCVPCVAVLHASSSAAQPARVRQRVPPSLPSRVACIFERGEASASSPTCPSLPAFSCCMHLRARRSQRECANVSLSPHTTPLVAASPCCCRLPIAPPPPPFETGLFAVPRVGAGVTAVYLRARGRKHLYQSKQGCPPGQQGSVAMAFTAGTCPR